MPIAPHPPRTDYDYPGNVRELENMVGRAVTLAPEGGIVEVFHLFVDPPGQRRAAMSINDFGVLKSACVAPSRVAFPSEALADGPEAVLQTFMRSCDAGNTLDDLEALVCRHAISQASGNLAIAARCIGLTRAQLAYRLRSRVECASRPATASWMQLIVEG